MEVEIELKCSDGSAFGPTIARSEEQLARQMQGLWNALQVGDTFTITRTS